MKKLSFDDTVAALKSKIEEAELNANSGDLLIASQARRDYISAMTQLQVISCIGKTKWNTTTMLGFDADDDADNAKD